MKSKGGGCFHAWVMIFLLFNVRLTEVLYFFIFTKWSLFHQIFFLLVPLKGPFKLLQLRIARVQIKTLRFCVYVLSSQFSRREKKLHCIRIICLFCFYHFLTNSSNLTSESNIRLDSCNFFF